VRGQPSHPLCSRQRAVEDSPRWTRARRGSTRLALAGRLKKKRPVQNLVRAFDSQDSVGKKVL
jgi:hypothetical protein